MSMTGKERFMTAMRHGQPDRIPLFDFLFMQDLFLEAIGHRPEAYNAEDAVACSLKLGFDSVWVPTDGFAGYAPTKLPDGSYVDEWGTTCKHNNTSWPIDAPIAYPIQNWEDYKNWSCPNPHDSHRTTSMKVAKKLAEDRIAVLGGVTGPFTTLFFLMGLEQTCMNVYDEPELIHAIMRQATDFGIAAGLHQIEAGADAMIISEDLGYNSGTFLSPDCTRSFILPYLREMTAAFRKTGVPLMLHCDGNMNGILEDFVHIGMDAWQPLERKGKNDLATIKSKYGSFLTPVGNVDSSITLPFGTTEDVVRQTLECMRIGGPGGGYILGSDHSLHDGIPVQNILTMIETCKKYGEYPLRLPNA